MKKISNKILLSLLVSSAFCVSAYCSQVVLPQAKRTNEANLFDYITSRHYRCGSFLVRYSPFRNLMGVLMIDCENNGYRIEIFEIYSQKKIFNFEPVTMPIDDFRLNEDSVIVNFADVYGSQIAYDVFTGAIIWQTN